MKKITTLSKSLDYRLPVSEKPKFVVLKGTAPDFKSGPRINEEKLVHLNKLANSRPFCIIHRVKKIDLL